MGIQHTAFVYFQRIGAALLGCDLSPIDQLRNDVEHWKDRAFAERRRTVQYMEQANNLTIELEKEKNMTQTQNTKTEAPVAPTSNELPVLPINLRPGVMVRIGGLPKDFHAGEAAYIANILKAYAQPIETPTVEDILGIDLTDPTHPLNHDSESDVNLVEDSFGTSVGRFNSQAGD